MGESFDLLGDPIPEGFGKRGRPPHMVTDEKRRLVIMLQAFDWSLERIAAALNCSPPTLRKNYFRELKAREESRARVEAMAFSALAQEVDAGNVSAIDKLFKRLDRHDLARLSHLAANRAPEEKDKKALGKKDARKLAAAEVGGIFAPPQPPGSKPN